MLLDSAYVLLSNDTYILCIALGVMFWHTGAYAPFILKCMLYIFWNVKKLKQKNRMYIFTCHTLTKLFHKQPTCHLACVKKQDSGAKKVLSQYKISHFLHRLQKVSFFCEIWQTHIYYGDVYVDFFVKFFYTSKYFFRIICTRKPNLVSCIV
jgi:hypothetical protein